MSIEQAKLVVVSNDLSNMDSTNKSKVENGLTFHFNPEELSMEYEAKFCPTSVPGISQEGQNEQMDYQGPTPKSLSLDAIFDTTEKKSGLNEAGDDVKEICIDVLRAMMEPSVTDGDKQLRPPKLQFVWGNVATENDTQETFFLTKLSVKYTLFDSSATPLRAETSLTLKKEMDIETKTNPTTRSVARKVWIVQQGESLDWIAYKEYGNPNHWRKIAQANNLLHPGHLKPGQILNLPQR